MPATNLPNGINVVDNSTIDDADGNIYCNTLIVNDTFSFSNFQAEGSLSTNGLQYVAGGGSVTIADNSLGVYITSAATTMTIIFPENPVDGQWLYICCTNTINAITTTPGTGQTILEDIESTTGAQQYKWIYRASNSTWYRFT